MWAPNGYLDAISVAATLQDSATLLSSIPWPLGICPNRQIKYIASPEDARRRNWAKVHTPFSLQDLRQIKTDLGRFSEDPDKYIKVFQNICQVFDLTWKDIMLLLNQTLTFSEKEAALIAAEEFGDDLHLALAPAEQTRSKPNYPSGAQAVPRNDSEWDPNDEQDAWKISHFQMLVLEALRRIKQKPINYSKVSESIQGPQESPDIFMEKLREAMRKHTTMDPESTVGQLLLKDKFITQSAADIRRKLQKLAYGPDQSLDNILQLATSIFL
ncbi:uncharacterized protein LOC143638599 [Callospermophilus lateralis]|uniref:uncharacterized protein LOC143638599 n=1 Tax=Callospermophilus lateralis TaxID=76772 RepID=UPI00405383BD